MLGRLQVAIHFDDVARPTSYRARWGEVDALPPLSASADLHEQIELDSNMGYHFALHWLYTRHWAGQPRINFGSWRPLRGPERMNAVSRFVLPLEQVYSLAMTNALKAMEINYVWQLHTRDGKGRPAEILRDVARVFRRAMPGLSDYALGRAVILALPFDLQWEELAEWPWGGTGGEWPAGLAIPALTPTQFYDQLETVDATLLAAVEPHSKVVTDMLHQNIINF